MLVVSHNSLLRSLQRQIFNLSHTLVQQQAVIFLVMGSKMVGFTFLNHSTTNRQPDRDRLMFDAI